MKKYKFISLIILFSVIIVCLLTSSSMALLGDKLSKLGIVTFTQQKLDITLLGTDTLVLTTEQLTAQTETTKTITIANPANSEDCLLRIWLEFSVNNERNYEYLSLNIDSTKFEKITNGTNENDYVFYLKEKFTKNTALESISLKFKVEIDNEQLDLYKGKAYNMKVYIESIEATKSALDAKWTSCKSTEWYNTIITSL